MTSTIDIRKARVEDSPLIAAMLARHFQEIGDAGCYRDDSDAIGRHGFGEHALFRTLIAEGPDQALGFVLYFPVFSTIRCEPGVHVQDIWVDVAARGQGLGRRLLAASAMDAASLWGATYLTLMVYDDNDGALAFYRRLGFVQDPRDRPLHIDGGAFRQLFRDGGGRKT
ncbi:MAG: N-acetyltransferase [Geminicoccaceae bacterium]